MPPNSFLESLDPEDAAFLRPHLRLTTLARDEIVAREGRSIEKVYLPLNCILSVVAVMSDGRQVETRTIGFEGATDSCTPSDRPCPTSGW